jgi:hypothetical protein
VAGKAVRPHRRGIPVRVCRQGPAPGKALITLENIFFIVCIVVKGPQKGFYHFIRKLWKYTVGRQSQTDSAAMLISALL